MKSEICFKRILKEGLEVEGCRWKKNGHELKAHEAGSMSMAFHCAVVSTFVYV